jgi:hypothetical protein
MAPNANMRRLHDAGVSIWLDTLSHGNRRVPKTSAEEVQ